MEKTAKLRFNVFYNYAGFEALKLGFMLVNALSNLLSYRNPISNCALHSYFIDDSDPRAVMAIVTRYLAINPSLQSSKTINCALS